MAKPKPMDPDVAARALEVYMSDLSENGYYAGWLSDLEFFLWEIVQKGEPPLFGQWEITELDIAVMSQLSGQAQGWVRYSDEIRSGAQCDRVPLEEWLRVYAEWEARRGA